jgi:uncharacterized membrane protein YhaH (DUF805 family)
MYSQEEMRKAARYAIAHIVDFKGLCDLNTYKRFALFYFIFIGAYQLLMFAIGLEYIETHVIDKDSLSVFFQSPDLLKSIPADFKTTYYTVEKSNDAYLLALLAGMLTMPLNLALFSMSVRRIADTGRSRWYVGVLFLYVLIFAPIGLYLSIKALSNPSSNATQNNTQTITEF